MLRKMKLKTRISSGFAVLIIIIILCAAGSISLIMRTASEKDAVYKNYGKSSQEILRSCVDYQELKFLLRNMLYVHENDDAARAEDIQNITDVVARMQEDEKNFQNMANLEVPAVKKQFDVVDEGMMSYVSSVLNIVSYVQQGDYQAGKDILTNELIDSAKTLDTEVDKLFDTLDEAEQDADNAAEKKIKYQLIFVFFMGVVAVAFAIIDNFTISIAIRRPIKLINDGIDRLTKGEVDINVRKINEDELGEVVDKINRLIEDTKKQAYIASEVAQGNLTVEVTPRSEMDVLGNALVKLVNDNNAVLTNIYESSSQVTTGSEQVASASQSLAQGSTEQASAIEQITASISEIADRTKKNAEQANAANVLVVTAKEDAEQGDVQMKDMIEAMTEINEASENISKIIKVIDDIAFQTNILALNAAVEAARAGSHGKGFAVVAEEVRSLAAKSASAASETAEMIEDSIKKVERGSSLATDTAKALEEIVESVERIVEIISDIASASNEQATAVAQIDQAIGQVSHVVQTNSATSQQCAAASEELSNQSARLREMLNRFRLKETDNSYTGYENSDYTYPENDSMTRTISLGDGFDKY